MTGGVSREDMLGVLQVYDTLFDSLGFAIRLEPDEFSADNRYVCVVTVRSVDNPTADCYGRDLVRRSRRQGRTCYGWRTRHLACRSRSRKQRRKCGLPSRVRTHSGRLAGKLRCTQTSSRGGGDHDRGSFQGGF